MRHILFSAALIGGTVIGGSAFGSDFWDRVHLDFMRMNCWPQPFVQADRELVNAPLIAMTGRGWQLQNTLSHHFFDEENQTLTRAGQLKLHWIVTQAPPHRRTVYVLRTLDPALTQTRVASVHDQMARLLPGERPQPEVLVSDMVPAGGSGDYFDQVDRQLKASVPAPRLPARGGVSEVGGGGG